MAITEQQRAERRNYIGSSDSAAILGLDPWRNAGDVYLSKVHDLVDDPSEEMQWGRVLEPLILDIAERHIGTLTRDVFRTYEEIFCANHDALVAGIPEGVEIKTSGDTFAWGDSGTDEIPENYIVQCHHQMLVSNLHVVHVPVLFAHRGFKLKFYRVERDDGLCKSIEDIGREFWNRYVVPRIFPDEYEPSIEVVKRVRRESGKTTQIPVEPVERWLRAKEYAKAANDEKEAAQAVLLAFMGDAEAADTPLGRIEYLTQRRAGYTVEPTTFRVLRHKGEKKNEHKRIGAA